MTSNSHSTGRPMSSERHGRSHPLPASGGAIVISPRFILRPGHTPERGRLLISLVPHSLCLAGIRWPGTSMPSASSIPVCPFPVHMSPPLPPQSILPSIAEISSLVSSRHTPFFPLLASSFPPLSPWPSPSPSAPCLHEPRKGPKTHPLIPQHPQQRRHQPLHNRHQLVLAQIILDKFRNHPHGPMHACGRAGV